MAEGAEGQKPKFEQARKPSEIEKDNFRMPSFKKQIAAGVLIVGTLGAAGAVTSRIEQDIKKDEDYKSLQSQEVKLDGSRIRIDGKNVRIREESIVPTQKGVDNRIHNDRIKSINGEAWDGKSDFVLENVPYLMDKNPSNPMQKAPWLILEIETDDGNVDLGYISDSAATSGIVQTVTRGEVADIRFDQNNNLEATFDSGKTITEGEIGKVEIVKNQQQDSG